MADLNQKEDSLEEETLSELAKSNFLARMSHEMRTPLNAIIGMSTIAQTTEDREKISQCLVKINEASIHLLEMINDILDLVKIEAGNLKLSYAEFNFPQMLNKTVDAAKFSLDAKKQNLILDFDPGLPETIIADQQKLSQVLDHFISNALKFTPPEGKIKYSVKKINEEGKFCTLKFCITDTGIGISTEVLKRIFSIFEQADGSVARKYSGSGMGLAICSAIVHLMGGEIRVESKPGEGSCFGFEVIVEQITKKTEERVSSANNKNTPALDKKFQFAGKTILLTEDVEINREIVISLLEETSIAISCAKNGIEAVNMVRENPSKYDLILMDIHMPEMDGYEATRQIRDFEEELKTKNDSSLLNHRERIPIVAMTANVFKDDVDKCFAVGMTGHLGKPIDIEEMMKQLEKYLL